MSRLGALVIALIALGAAAMGPLEKNHPLVADGTAAYELGRFEEAVEKFDAAARELPGDPRVQYDRGLALHKLGREAEAKAALERATGLDRDGALEGKIHYALGNVAAAEGRKRDALAEYRKALLADPSDDDARHNFEVIAKDIPPPSDTGPDGGEGDGGDRPDGGHPDGGRPDGGARDSGVDAGRPDGGRPNGDGGSGDGGTDGGRPTGGDGGQADGGRGDGGPGEQERGGDGGTQGGEGHDGGAEGHMESSDGGASAARLGMADGGPDVSKLEAEQLLDALKSSEKNMQLWRFRQKPTKSEPHAKDW